MSSVLYALALLACPVAMGLMMFMMMRGQNKSSARPGAGRLRGSQRGRCAPHRDRGAQGYRALRTHRNPHGHEHLDWRLWSPLRRSGSPTCSAFGR